MFAVGFHHGLITVGLLLRLLGRMVARTDEATTEAV
jgi:hypothetical protein